MYEGLTTTMRWKGTVAYDGTSLFGWQSQVGGNTVQDFIESRLVDVFQQFIRIHGSGRTDSGAHARGQVFHFDGIWNHPVSDLKRALKTGLPSTILITGLGRAPDDFHARYSAIGKRYCYRIYEGSAMPFETRFYHSLGNRRLNAETMQAAADRLLGKHDFTAYGANRGDESKEDPVKELRLFKITRSGRKVIITVEGSGFLYKMVRSLAGALIDVGTGKLTVHDLEMILHGKVRTREVVTAPARGLCLEKVFYP